MDYTSILQSVITIAATVVSGFISKYVHDKSKANALDQSLTIASQYAKDIVINLSQRGDLTNSEKFKTAYLFVVDKLKKQNIHVTEQTITNKIVEAYQTYKKDGGDIHKFIPDVVNEAEDDFVKTAQTVSQEQPVQQPTVQPTVVAPVQQPVETKVEEPKTDEAKDEGVSIDAPKSDAPVANSGVQQAPVNPYIK